MPPEVAEAAVASAPVSDTPVDSSVDNGGGGGGDNGVDDPQLAAFFGEKPAERETPTERGAPTKTEQPPAEKPDAENHQAAETEQPETDGFDDDLLAWAEAHKLSADTARAFPNAETLRRTLVDFDRHALAASKAKAGETKVPEGQEAKVPAQEAPAQKPDDAAKAATLLEKFKLEIDPDALDERAATTLMQFNDHVHSALEAANQKIAAYEKRFGELEGKFGQHAQDVSLLIQDRERAHFEQLMSTADSFFNAQTDFAAQLGKGTVKDIKPGSPEFTTRQNLFSDAMQLQELDRAQGRQPGSFESYLKRALVVSNWDKQTEIARQKVASEVAERKASAVARPTQRRSSAVSAEARSVQKIREVMRKAGTTGSGRDELANWE